MVGGMTAAPFPTFDRAAGWNLLAPALLRKRRRGRQSESGGDKDGEQWNGSWHD
jgi:hypothetical protein